MKFLPCIFLLLTFCASAAETPTRYFILVRHGQASNNLENVYNSDPNNPHYKPANLTEQGKAEVKQTAQSLIAQGFSKDNIVAVFTSPLPRSVQTAQIMSKEGLFPADMIAEDPRLTEMRAGDMEGKAVVPLWPMSFAIMHHGETQEQVNRRVLEFYEFVQKEYPSGNVVIITHGGPALSLIELLTRQEVKLGTGQALLLPIK